MGGGQLADSVLKVGSLSVFLENLMSPQRLFEIASTVLFALALIHTFSTGYFTRIAHRFREGSVAENFFHLFGEVEIVFGLWSAVLIIFGILFIDFNFINDYLNSRVFTEPLFVFVIMAVCSTEPILRFVENVLLKFSYLLPVDPGISVYFTLLFISPLMGSFITEPAAMTISAYLLLPRYFTRQHSLKFKYATIALLFLNISIGGTLTPFAAPPVLMVAQKWNWDLAFMLTNFAPQTIIATFLNTLLFIYIFKKEIVKNVDADYGEDVPKIPFYVIFIHLLFLSLIVLSAHYPILFLGLFLFLIGFMRATREYQKHLSLREPLLVSFFLAGLIILGGPQQWWLTPVLSALNKYLLYFGSIGLTAFTDNAALTYLGSLVPDLDPESKLALVKGSVVGGGLTLIANAPNPAGFGVLRHAFDEYGFSALGLLVWSLPITIITAIMFLF